MHSLRELLEFGVDVLAGLRLGGDDIADDVERPVEDVDQALFALVARAVGLLETWLHVAPVRIGGDRA